MDVEINLSTDPTNRGRRGRALVADAHEPPGSLYFGHRGGLGGGRGGELSIIEFTGKICEFSPTDIIYPDGSTEEIFIIGAVKDNNFVDELARYVSECARLRREARRPAGVISPISADPVAFDSGDVWDGRERVMCSIKARRGQASFRQALIEPYRSQCAISCCSVLDVLEAAHITPYLGPETNHVTNGILLRADIHTLFDLYRISIHPETLKIVLHPELLSSEYGSFQGKHIARPFIEQACPSKIALLQHFNCCGFASSA